MDYDEIFEAYYSLYRTEASIPNSEDDEYKVGFALAKEAVNRWGNYDGGFWKELFNTAQINGNAELILTTATNYATPTDMRKAGGYIRVFNADNVTVRRIPIIEPQDTQFRSDTAHYAYFIGDPNHGFTLVLNPVPDTSVIGMGLDYIYYKKPTKLVKGSSKPDMSQPYFIVHRMLANRFRGSRNPYYQSAKNDAEDILASMKMEEMSGNWADPWKLQDHSGSVWGS